MFRGRPFDSEGALANLVATDYLFSARARSEFFQVNQGQNSYFHPQRKKGGVHKEKKAGGGGSWNVGLEGKQGRIVHVICRLPVRACAYSVHENGRLHV